MPLYRSRLFVMDPDEGPRPPYIGRGWEAWFRPLAITGTSDRPAVLKARAVHQSFIIKSEPLTDGHERTTFAPEIMFGASSRLAAQRVAGMVAAAKTLLDGDFSFGEPYTVVADDETHEDLRPPEYDAALGTCVGTHGFGLASALAAKISRKRPWVNALTKYWLSLRTCSVPAIEHHPRYGDQFTVQRDAFHHAVMAQAIVSAYSAVEEMNLEVKASERNPSKIDGAWNPAVLSDLLNRLRAAGINADKPLVWIIRNPPTRIHRKYNPPKGTRPSWAVYHIRDRMVPLVDAIHYASVLRSRVSAHRMHALTRSLTIHDVINAQHVARRLLLEATGFWRRS